MKKFSLFVADLIIVVALLSFPAGPVWAVEYVFTTLDCPYSTGETVIHGVDESGIVGYYATGSPHGFVYDGTTWITLDHPNSGSEFWFTEPQAISGNMIVGNIYRTGGDNRHSAFVYDGSEWEVIDYPGAEFTEAYGVEGDIIVGTYYVSSGEWHGFVYDGTSWITVDYPEATDTQVYDINGNNIVGEYEDAFGYEHGFLYDGANWISLDYPGTYGTEPTGISDNNIVGTCDRGTHGFLYDGTNWITLDHPDMAHLTGDYDIDGGVIVGTYIGQSSGMHGFIATPVPLPSTLFLLGSALVSIRAVRRQYVRQ